MSDRYNALTVVLDFDYKEEDAQIVINAIKALRGVQSVEPNVAHVDSHVALMRSRSSITKKLLSVIEDFNK